MLLLHETDQESALATATRLRAALHDMTGSDWVTASMGVSTWQGPNDGPDALLRRADEALYVAKRSGRDCAVAWEPPVSEPSNGLQWLRGRARQTTVRLASTAEAVG